MISEREAIHTGNLIGGERREAVSGRPVESGNPALVAALKEQFLQDLKESQEITLAGWTRRPRLDRPYELIGWALRRWL